MSHAPSLGLYCAALLALAACSQAGAPGADPAAMMQDAQRHEKDGDLAGAAMLYHQVTMRDPETPGAKLALATVTRKAGQPDKALAMLEQEAARRPDDVEVLKQLGYAQIESGKPEAAIGTFDKLLAISPGSPIGYNGKAVAFDHTGNHSAAQDLYEAALKADPGSPSIQNNLAMSLILNRQPAQAVAVLEKLNAQHSTLTVRMNLALAYGLSGQKDKALELAKKDLTPQQAEENVRAYELYAAQLAALPRDEQAATIGFAATPADIMQQPAPEQSKPAAPVSLQAEPVPMQEPVSADPAPASVAKMDESAPPPSSPDDMPAESPSPEENAPEPIYPSQRRR